MIARRDTSHRHPARTALMALWLVSFAALAACGQDETSAADTPPPSSTSATASSGYFGSSGAGQGGGSAGGAGTVGAGGVNEAGGAGGVASGGGGAPMYTCDQIHQIYEKNTGAAKQMCDAATTCAIVTGHCMVGLGAGCWYVLDGSVSQMKLNKLAAEWTDLGCQGVVCSTCPPLPPGGACDQGMCVPAP